MYERHTILDGCSGPLRRGEGDWEILPVVNYRETLTSTYWWNQSINQSAKSAYIVLKQWNLVTMSFDRTTYSLEVMSKQRKGQNVTAVVWVEGYSTVLDQLQKSSYHQPVVCSGNNQCSDVTEVDLSVHRPTSESRRQSSARYGGANLAND